MKKKKSRPTLWKNDSFENWVIDIGDKVAELLASLPPELSEQLNYSVQSLHVFEKYLMDNFTYETITLAENHQLLDKFSRYVGEVARRQLQKAQWDVILDKKNVYYGVPLIKAPFIANGEFCPIYTITAAVHKRVGNFLHFNIQGDIDRQKAADL